MYNFETPRSSHLFLGCGGSVCPREATVSSYHRKCLLGRVASAAKRVETIFFKRGIVAETD